MLLRNIVYSIDVVLNAASFPFYTITERRLKRLIAFFFYLALPECGCKGCVLKNSPSHTHTYIYIYMCV